jgi:hypothetical protein
LGRSRAATFGRLFEGTDEISLGQTLLTRKGFGAEIFTSTPTVTASRDC